MASKILSWDEWQDQKKKGTTNKTVTNADKLLSGSSTGSKSSSSDSTSGSKTDSESSSSKSNVISWDEWQEKMKNPTKSNKIGSAVATAVSNGLKGNTDETSTKKQSNADKLVNGTSGNGNNTYGASVAKMMDDTVKTTANSLQTSAKEQAAENTKSNVSNIAKYVANQVHYPNKLCI